MLWSLKSEVVFRPVTLWFIKVVAAYPNPMATPWEMCDIPMKSSKNRKIPKQIETDRKIKYKLKYLFRFSIQIKGIFTIFNHQKLLFHAECRSFYCKYILNNEL